MPTVRESIARKVQAGGAAELTAEESVDVLKMIHELGQHETAAIKHQRETAAHVAEKEAKEREIEGLHAFIAKDRRTLRDMFIASALGAGKSPDAAIAIADQTMTLREVRRV